MLAEIYIKTIAILAVIVCSILLIGFALKKIRYKNLDATVVKSRILQNIIGFFKLSNCSDQTNASEGKSITINEIHKINIDVSLVRFTYNASNYICIVGTKYGFLVEKTNIE